MLVGQITARFMCAAVIYDSNNHVKQAAPILRYMVGWTAEQVEVYCQRRKFGYQSFDPTTEEDQCQNRKP